MFAKKINGYVDCRTRIAACLSSVSGGGPLIESVPALPHMFYATIGRRRYPKGTVTAIYTTTDGGPTSTVQGLYDLVALLGDHVELVNHENIADFALRHHHGKKAVKTDDDTLLAGHGGLADAGSSPRAPPVLPMAYDTSAFLVPPSEAARPAPRPVGVSACAARPLKGAGGYTFQDAVLCKCH